MNILVFAMIVNAILTAFLLSISNTFSAPLVSTANLTTDIDTLTSTWSISKSIGNNAFFSKALLNEEQPVEQLKTSMMAEIVPPAAVRSRSMEGARALAAAKKESKMSFSLNSSGYIVLFCVVVLVILLFFFLSMYAQQREHTQAAAEADSNSQDASEAKEELNGRLYVFKRYIPFHFETGLPSPSHFSDGNNSISNQIVPVTPKEKTVCEKPIKVATLAFKTPKDSKIISSNVMTAPL